MKNTLIAIMITLSLTSVARGAEGTNPPDRSIKIDWIKNPGAKKVIAGVETKWTSHCIDDMKIIPTGDFSDANGDNWVQTGVNSGNESIWSINSEFTNINVDEGKFGNNTVTCNLVVEDGTKFKATYDFETVEQEALELMGKTSKEYKDLKVWRFGKTNMEYTFNVTSGITAEIEWSESTTTTGTFDLTVTGQGTGSLTGTIVMNGVNALKSLVWAVAGSLGADIGEKIEKVTGKKLSGSEKFSTYGPMPVNVPVGFRPRISLTLMAESHYLKKTTYTDSDENGFPDSETPEIIYGYQYYPTNLTYDGTAEIADDGTL